VAALGDHRDHRLMLRDKNLVPLSHQHQHALAVCVRLDRGLQAGEVDLEAWQAELQQIFESEIGLHFAAEERNLFPAAASFSELRNLVHELVAEHAVLRDFFSRASARELDSAALGALAKKLSGHIRKEERQLFENMQKLMTPDELTTLGRKLQTALAESPQVCIVPSEATRLRPKKK
jgi:iron-sulfur cluster repair protein YtfE (RIC family)